MSSISGAAPRSSRRPFLLAALASAVIGLGRFTGHALAAIRPSHFNSSSKPGRRRTTVRRKHPVTAATQKRISRKRRNQQRHKAHLRNR